MIGFDMLWVVFLCGKGRRRRYPSTAPCRIERERIKRWSKFKWCHAACFGSVNGNLPPLRLRRYLLGQGQGQDPILIAGGNSAFVDPRHIKGPGKGTIPPLPADVVALLVLLPALLLVLGLDRKSVV